MKYRLPLTQKALKNGFNPFEVKIMFGVAAPNKFFIYKLYVLVKHFLYVLNSIYI